MVVAFAVSAAIVAQLTGTAPARATGTAAPAISIAVTSGFKPVTHDVFVVFHAGSATSARIHGTITGATAGEVAAVYGQEFPYKKPAVRLQSLALKTAKTAYSFTVTPVLATRYAVRLFADGTAKAKQIATSAAVNLYVIANGFFTGGQGACTTRPVCHKTANVFAIVPSTALGVEMGKRIHPYFGLSLAPPGNTPPQPKSLILDGGHARASSARKISSIEFKTTITFTFTIGSNDSYAYDWLTCWRDSEPKDGIGLPGYHDCGAARVPRTIAYLG